MYCEVVHYLGESHAPDDLIAETEAGIMRFTQPLNSTPFRYAELLQAKALRFNPVYNEYRLKGNFIKGLPHSMHQSMRLSRISNKHVTV